jgi:hypothetical protein
MLCMCVRWCFGRRVRHGYYFVTDSVMHQRDPCYLQGFSFVICGSGVGHVPVGMPYNK